MIQELPPEELAYSIRIDDVRGFPDTIVNDLKRVDADEAERLRVAHWYHDEKDESVVVVKSLHDTAMQWLYDWLEDTAQHYKSEFADASGEYRAAKEMANAVYDELSA